MEHFDFLHGRLLWEIHAGSSPDLQFWWHRQKSLHVRQNKTHVNCQSVVRSPPSTTEQKTTCIHALCLRNFPLSHSAAPPSRVCSLPGRSVFEFATFSLTGDETVLTSITRGGRRAGRRRDDGEREKERKKGRNIRMSRETARGMISLRRGEDGCV